MRDTRIRAEKQAKARERGNSDKVKDNEDNAGTQEINHKHD